MAKAWQYPKWRYYLMQAVLWGVLGLMIGAAGLVDRHRRKALEVHLAPAQTRRNLTVRLPEGWRSTGKLDPDSPVMFRVVDPMLPQTLQVVRRNQTFFSSPAKYIARSTGKTMAMEMQSMLIAGMPGSIARATVHLPEEQQVQEIEEVEIITAATSLPSGHLVEVQLAGAARPGHADLDLVKRVAASIEAHGEPKLTGDDIRLRDGTTIVLPEGYQSILTQDPNRTGCEMRLEAGGANLWRGVMMVPCAILPNDGLPQITQLCNAWDSSWRPARSRLIAPRRWHVQPTSDSWSEYAASEIYAMSDAQGHGLLAVFEGNGSDSSWIEPLWKTISQGVRFPQANDLLPRIAAGNEAVAQIREHGLSAYLPAARDEQWWLYCYGSPDHPFGWLHEEPGITAWAQTNSSRLFYPDEGYATITQHWDGSPNLAAYECGIQYRIVPLHDGDTIDQRLAAKLSKGKIELSASGTEIDSLTTSIVPPANYLPGGWIGRLIGKLPEKPMLLETESLVGYEDRASPALMRLLITPSSDVAHGGAPDARPLRCMNVEVNGSGEITRWFIREDGSLDSLDYSDGLRRVRSDLSIVRNAFATSDMKP